jgi:RHS repeat-associated protein
MFNGSGLVDEVDYYPFGDLTPGSPSVPSTTHLFTGHERDLGDLSSGLDYMHARYYSSGLGRFLSVDPVGGEVGSSQSWNRYAYARGNPVIFLDPNGRWVKLSTGGKSASLKAALVQLVRRPSGRAHLATYANDPTKSVAFREERMNSPANQKLENRSTGKTTHHWGNTSGRAVVDDETIVTVSVDMTEVKTSHPSDNSGVTTIEHEMYHVDDVHAGKSTEELQLGDSPTNMTGPAEQAGEAVFQEEPTLSTAEAEAIVDDWLTKGAPKE